MPAQCRLALLNPNSNEETTKLICKIARNEVPSDVELVSATMADGPQFIADEDALKVSASKIIRAGLQAEKEGASSIVIAGFGDPGLFELRELSGIPVTGIAEAGMAIAAQGGRPFSIITTTPELLVSIEKSARRYGHINALRGVHVTSEDAELLMSNSQRMSEALLALAMETIERDGAEALLICGGPLAPAAALISEVCPVPIIEPVLEGVRLGLLRTGYYRVQERAS